MRHIGQRRQRSDVRNDAVARAGTQSETAVVDGELRARPRVRWEELLLTKNEVCIAASRQLKQKTQKEKQKTWTRGRGL